MSWKEVSASVQQSPRRGFILVFSFIALTLLIIAALSVAMIATVDRQNAGISGKSNNAFQVADSGVEAVLKRAYKDADNTLTDVADALPHDGSSGKCTNGTISTNAGYEVTFYDKNGTALDCYSTTWRTDVDSIKSVGTSGGTVRAINTAVAASGGSGITGGCVLSNTILANPWGNGCKSSGGTYGSCSDAADSDYKCGPTSYDSVGSYYYCVCVKG